MDLYLVAPFMKTVKPTIIETLHSNVLYNFYSGKKDVDKDWQYVKFYGGKIFVDSGAFSAWTRGVKIDVDDYIKWLNERDYIDLCGQLDTIPGDRVYGATLDQVNEAARMTWENYLYMYERVKNPKRLLYTFHVGEPIEFLKQALEWRDSNEEPIEYIALGGMVGKSTAIRKSFLDKCFEIIENSSNPFVKVHTFGMTSVSLLRQYPITSCDSTSWALTGAMGNIAMDVGIIAVSSQQKNDPNYYLYLPKEAREAFEKSILDLGFNIEELAEDANKRAIFNATYMKSKIDNIVYQGRLKHKSLF